MVSLDAFFQRHVAVSSLVAQAGVLFECNPWRYGTGIRSLSLGSETVKSIQASSLGEMRFPISGKSFLIKQIHSNL